MNKLCPFCAGRPLVKLRCLRRTIRWRGRSRVVLVYRVVCRRCRALGPRKPTDVLAVRAWNRRRP